jgi:hypothetical protein
MRKKKGKNGEGGEKNIFITLKKQETRDSKTHKE